MTGMNTRKISRRKVERPAPHEVAAKQCVHYTAQYIIDPQHPVTVNVIGCGGTGSQVLNSLARMNSALKALGHPGLYVRAIDPDKVTDANMGRQLFSPADVGLYKCVSLVGRVNRFFGYDWEAVPTNYDRLSGVKQANITISCVDTGAARKEIKSSLIAPELVMAEATRNNPAGMNWYRESRQPYEIPYYWMDFGNMMDRGQVVIGTIASVEQPKKSEFETRVTMPTIDKYHPEIFKDLKGEDQGPSCSLAEALGKQDLFINTNLANMGMGILWKMFRELRIRYHGCYVNLETLSVNPIKIK
jgi:PRTRC genetic system ThiF family protein